MDNIYSPIPNSIPPLPGSNPCELVSSVSKEPLNFGITISAPVSSVAGSATFFFVQPVFAGQVFASLGVLIAAQLFLFLAERFFRMPVQKGPVISPNQTVRMSLSDLQDFLASMSRGDIQPSTGTSVPSTNQIVPGTIPLATPEIPVVFSFGVWGDFTDKAFGPTVFITIPLFSLPGVRGALPLLILELLTTIFVRAVVPPESTGARPLTEPASNSESQTLEFSPEDLLNQLDQFNKHSENLRLFP